MHIFILHLKNKLKVERPCIANPVYTYVYNISMELKTLLKITNPTLNPCHLIVARYTFVCAILMGRPKHYLPQGIICVYIYIYIYM